MSDFAISCVCCYFNLINEKDIIFYTFLLMIKIKVLIPIQNSRMTFIYGYRLNHLVNSCCRLWYQWVRWVKFKIKIGFFASSYDWSLKNHWRFKELDLSSPLNAKSALITTTQRQINHCQMLSTITNENTIIIILNTFSGLYNIIIHSIIVFVYRLPEKREHSVLIKKNTSKYSAYSVTSNWG